MGSVIRVLKDDVVNKIAAGEVVENPASVVKELVENSLDAGAKEIIVEIKGGGRQLIRITDNGCGMTADDAILCIERHATSKINDLDDLNRLSTMGFRGEAIASIASISKFTLMTSEEDGKGSLVFVDGGKMIKQAKAPRSQGTTIEVRSLFFNVPVRKKFQKSPAYDSSKIFEIISLLALGNPDVNFMLIRDGQTALKTRNNEKLKERISSILSDDFLRACLPLEANNLQGFIGNPSYTRHNRLGQYLFINRRPVTSLAISRAVREGYGTTIAPQRFPVFVLHFNMPGFDVDVNVHPQKREVRLRDEESVIHHFRNSVSQALQKKEAKVLSVTPRFATYDRVEEKVSVVEETAKTYSVPIEAEHPEFEFTPTALKVEGPRVIHTLKGFIIAEDAEGLIIIDQRRAHHRILFDKLLNVKEDRAFQNLLIPEQIELTKVEAEAMREHLQWLQTLGFGIREFGPQAFVVESLPESFSKREVPIMIRNILEDLREYPSMDERERVSRLIAIAKRGAISRRVRLGLIEAKELVRKLWNSEASKESPNGEKIWTLLTNETISSLL